MNTMDCELLRQCPSVKEVDCLYSGQDGSGGLSHGPLHDRLTNALVEYFEDTR